MKRFAEMGGYAGMLLIHSATLPPIIGHMLGASGSLPPISMILMVWAGLLLFLIRAIAQKDLLYTISNAIGFFFNSILLVMILMG